MEHIWKSALLELADSPEEFEESGGRIAFTRNGADYELDLREIPGLGTSVIGKPGTATPIAQYIQKDLLRLHVLAAQINKAIETAIANSKGRHFFIEVPANVVTEQSERRSWAKTAFELEKQLVNPPSESTQVIELMAPAGFGKSFLLTHIARDLATKYFPQNHPSPILLPVDLLGRHIGTLDDAIAGSINNTYRFPGLSQRDVALCVRLRWLVLAFDGFDELVGRVGIRDAFSKLAQFVDQLNGSGTVLISARDGYFDQHEITIGMNSYFLPTRGSHSTFEVALAYWTEKQGEEVFERLGSKDPKGDLASLLNEFDNDPTIVFHPYFLTHLARLKRNGPIPIDKSRYTHDSDARTKYLIELIIENRETERKWRSIMTQAESDRVLGYIAQEMWRTGSFRLSGEELQTAAQIELNDFKKPTELVDIASKMPNHAAFEPAGNRSFRFAHDKIFHYYLGMRLAQIIKDGKLNDLAFVLQARELNTEIIRWAAWNLADNDVNLRIKDLTDPKASELEADAVARANLGQLVARLLPRRTGNDKIIVSKLLIGGDSMKAQTYKSITFDHCNFFECDISGTRFENCTFVDCQWSDVIITQPAPSMVSSEIIDGRFEIVSANGQTLYEPSAIKSYFEKAGANFAETSATEGLRSPLFDVPQEVIDCVEYYIHKSSKTWFVTIEEVEDKFGDVAKDVARAALRHQIMGSVNKDKKGRPKSFLRFEVDRTRLLHGLDGSASDANIVAFWRELER